MALQERTGRVTERELAEHLAGAEPEQSVDTPEEIRTVRLRLRHVHLPKLDDVGLVTWNETDETVTLTDHPVHDNTRFQQIIATEDDDWDDVVAALVSEHRRVVLSVLESESRSVARADLVREVARRVTDGEPSANAVDDVRVQLHHVHLPKLNQAGLIDHNTDDGTVAYTGHPELPRMDSLNALSL